MHSARPFVLLLCLAPLAACQTTPITGKSAFNLFSVSDDVELGREAYAQVLAEGKVVDSGAELAMVERVMQKITAVSDDAGYEWEVTLLDDPSTVNAFALPGGKMAVYSGILPVCQSEAGLAVVMGHEIGHVVARHGTQRLSSDAGIQVGLSMVNPDYQVLAGTVLNLAVALPYSRSMESEADHIGLIYLARAGYDPEEAIRFWQRMEESSGGGAPPEFLSTHPSHETRIERLKEILPEARALQVSKEYRPGP